MLSRPDTRWSYCGCAFAILFALSACAWTSSNDLTFSGFYKSPNDYSVYWKWGAIVGVAVLAGIAAYFTAGTAPPLIGSIGTWIGNAIGLYGAAAQGYGLALLGGGAIAAGGLGIKGGIAVLAAAITFGHGAGIELTRTAVDWALDPPISKGTPTGAMIVFPLPYVEHDPPAYTRAITELKSYNQDVPTPPARMTVRGFLRWIYAFEKRDKDNKETIRAARNKLIPPDGPEIKFNFDDVNRVRIAQSILALNEGDYAEAQKHSESILKGIATESGIKENAFIELFSAQTKKPFRAMHLTQVTSIG